MAIRKMLPADYDAVYALWRATPGMGLNETEDSRAGIERYLRRNPDTCFVSDTADGGINGAILTGHDGRRGYIYHAAVAQTARGQGLGRALVDAAMAALRAEGILKTALVAYETNALGNGFWERLGFTPRADLVYRDHVL